MRPSKPYHVYIKGGSTMCSHISLFAMVKAAWSCAALGMLLSTLTAKPIHGFVIFSQGRQNIMPAKNLLLHPPTRQRYRPHGPFQLYICTVRGARTGVEIPLLDLSDDYRDTYVQPLPATHLPDEMTTLHVYSMQVTVPLHQSIIEYAQQHPVCDEEDGSQLQPIVGHVAWKPSGNDTTLIGAIGCGVQILASPMTNNNNVEEPKPSEIMVLGRGTYRFIVREIKQSIPFPVAVVDELRDDPVTIGDESIAGKESSDNDDAKRQNNDEEDDEDEDEYAALSPSDLVQRTLQALQFHVDQQLNVTASADGPMSPLEQSILEESGDFSLTLEAARQAAEETAAVWAVFQDYLIDLCPDPTDRYYSVAFMAAEMANLNNAVRRRMLQLTSGVERLRTVVLPVLEEIVGMARARQVAHDIVQPTAADAEAIDLAGGQDLQVGAPTLPPWAAQIRKGVRIEYFWNEEYEWVAGTVVEDPMWIVDEYVLTIEFDDGETHRLPFDANEKARWRPGRPK